MTKFRSQIISTYKTSKKVIKGSSFSEVKKKAYRIFNLIKSKTKRIPYLRSRYFRKEKVFLNLFWQHLFDKFSDKDKIRRLKYYDCAIDLIRNSTIDPETKENVDNRSELLHRFTGTTGDREKFYFQVKEDKRSKRKDLISIFPEL